MAAALARLESPAAVMWHDTRNALRACNACEPPELRAAKLWIDALAERFGHDAG